MATLITHPLEIYAVYILLAVGLAWYFSSAKGDISSIEPGSTFVVMAAVKLIAALVFFGIPGGLVFFLPEASNPFAATMLTVGVALLCTALFICLVATKVEITEHGFAVGSIGWKREYRFEEFKAVSVFRFSIVLERRDGVLNLALPAVFSNVIALNHYLKLKIEN